jgi:uncharacterized membrane protein
MAEKVTAVAVFKHRFRGAVLGRTYEVREIKEGVWLGRPCSMAAVVFGDKTKLVPTDYLEIAVGVIKTED